MNHQKAAIRITLLYLTAATLWIIVSDYLMAATFNQFTPIIVLEILKSAVFIGVSGFVLYFLVYQELQHRQRVEIERRNAEAEIRYHGSLIANVSDAVISLDKELKIKSWNHAAEASYGWGEGEVIGKSLDIIQAKNTNLTQPLPINMVLESGHWTGELLHAHKNGSAVAVLVSADAIKDHDGSFVGLVTVNRDITKEKHSDLLQSVSDAVFSSDLNYTIKTWNRAAENIYGWKAQEIIGQPASVLQTQFMDKTREQVLQELREQGAWNGEVTQKRKDGSTVHILASGNLIKDREGKPVGTVTVNRDITKEKQIEIKLQETELLLSQLEKERELVELKERFISMVSHDFRTPLTVIVTSTDLLEYYADRLTPERRNEHLHKIRSQSRYMQGLLNDVLTFTKGQAGKLEFKPTKLNLDGFCQALMEQMRTTDTDNHQWEFNSSASLGEMWMDEKLMQQIFVNLLTNAMKYSPTASLIQFEAARNGTSVDFKVIDHGIGIPEADLARLFEPFHRAGNVNDIKGTGLGLAIVKNSVDTHGGTITCESTLGEGTTFIVSLPLSSATTHSDNNSNKFKLAIDEASP